MATSKKTARGPVPKSLAERLETRIARVKGCWIYQGVANPNGYASIGIAQKPGQPYLSRLVHRAAYETFVGPIAKGMTIDHLCRTKLCINPKHLEVVSQKENSFRAPNYVGNRTQCPRGHRYTPENTRTWFGQNNSWRRGCKTCHKDREATRRINMKERIAS